MVDGSSRQAMMRQNERVGVRWRGLEGSVAGGWCCVRCSRKALVTGGKVVARFPLPASMLTQAAHMLILHHACTKSIAHANSGKLLHGLTHPVQAQPNDPSRARHLTTLVFPVDGRP